PIRRAAGDAVSASCATASVNAGSVAVRRSDRAFAVRIRAFPVSGALRQDTSAPRAGANPPRLLRGFAPGARQRRPLHRSAFPCRLVARPIARLIAFPTAGEGAMPGAAVPALALEIVGASGGIDPHHGVARTVQPRLLLELEQRRVRRHGGGGG